MNTELTDFLRRNRACAGGIMRLEASGAETLEDAWKLAAPADLVWGVTRPGVMSPEQRRQFLVMVLSSIEDKLTDPRSRNILDKLRTNSPITEADAAAAYAAYTAAEYAAEASSWAADAACASAYESARAAAYAAAWAAAAAADVSADVSAARAAAREAQAKWIRDNFALSDLNIN